VGFQGNRDFEAAGEGRGAAVAFVYGRKWKKSEEILTKIQEKGKTLT